MSVSEARDEVAAPCHKIQQRIGHRMSWTDRTTVFSRTMFRHCNACSIWSTKSNTVKLLLQYIAVISSLILHASDVPGLWPSCLRSFCAFLPPLKTTVYHLRKCSHGLELSAVQCRFFRKKNCIPNVVHWHLLKLCIFNDMGLLWMLMNMFYTFFTIIVYLNLYAIM